MCGFHTLHPEKLKMVEFHKMPHNQKHVSILIKGLTQY